MTTVLHRVEFPDECALNIEQAVSELHTVYHVQHEVSDALLRYTAKFRKVLLKSAVINDGEIPELAMKIAYVWAAGLAEIGGW